MLVDGTAYLAPMRNPHGYLADIAERAAGVDQAGRFPRESLDLLHAEGLLGLTARRADGGADAGLADAAEVVRAVGRSCASTGLILAMQLIHLRTAARLTGPRRSAPRSAEAQAATGP